MSIKGWCKLNMNGCRNLTTNLAGGGGVMRDHRESWLGGFSILLGDCNEVEAEFWAAIHGLRLAWNMGHKLIMLEVDSLLLYNWLKEAGEGTHRYRNLLEECRRWISADWQVQIQHTFREANMVAYKLAALALKLPNGNLHKWTLPPKRATDKNGHLWPRRTCCV